MPICDDSALKQSIGIFCTMHKQIIGAPYMVQWGKDQKIMKQIIMTYGSPRTYSLISIFFEQIRTDEFLRKTGATVGIFKTQIPKLLMILEEKIRQNSTGRL